MTDWTKGRKKVVFQIKEALEMCRSWLRWGPVVFQMFTMHNDWKVKMKVQENSNQNFEFERKKVEF